MTGQPMVKKLFVRIIVKRQLRHKGAVQSWRLKTKQNYSNSSVAPPLIATVAFRGRSRVKS